MAGRSFKEAIPIQIPYPQSGDEVRSILASIGTIKSEEKNPLKFIATYRYVFQQIKIVVVVKEHKRISVIQILTKADDLLGIGAKKALKKIKNELLTAERRYSNYYEIERAADKLIRDQMDVDAYSKLISEYNLGCKRSRILYALSLGHIVRKNLKDAEETIAELLNQSDKNQQIKIRQEMALRCYRSHLYTLSSNLLAELADPECDDKTAMLFFLSSLNAELYAQAAHFAARRFFRNNNFFYQAIIEKSLLPSCRAKASKLEVLVIRAIRVSSKFKLDSNAIKYIKQGDPSNAILLDLRKSLQSYYERPIQKIKQLIPLLKHVRDCFVKVEAEARGLMLRSNNKELSEFGFQSRKLNEVLEECGPYLDNDRSDYYVSKINKSISAMSSNTCFADFEECVNGMSKLNKALIDYSNEIQIKLINTLELYSLEGNKEALEKLIFIFQRHFPERLIDQDAFMQLADQRITRKQKKKKFSIISGLAACAIVVAVFIFSTRFTNAASTSAEIQPSPIADSTPPSVPTSNKNSYLDNLLWEILKVSESTELSAVSNDFGITAAKLIFKEDSFLQIVHSTTEKTLYESGKISNLNLLPGGAFESNIIKGRWINENSGSESGNIELYVSSINDSNKLFIDLLGDNGRHFYVRLDLKESSFKNVIELLAGKYTPTVSRLSDDSISIKKDSLLKLLTAFYDVFGTPNFEADDYFGPQILRFINAENITPEQLNEIAALEVDYTDRETQIIEQDIKYLSSLRGNSYWSFWIQYSCFRPSKTKYQNCIINIELGVDSTNKIISYKELAIEQLTFSDER